MAGPLPRYREVDQVCPAYKRSGEPDWTRGREPQWPIGPDYPEVGNLTTQGWWTWLNQRWVAEPVPKRELSLKKLDELQVYVVSGLLVKTFSTHCDFYEVSMCTAHCAVSSFRWISPQSGFTRCTKELMASDLIQITRATHCHRLKPKTRVQHHNTGLGSQTQIGPETPSQVMKLRRLPEPQTVLWSCVYLQTCRGGM